METEELAWGEDSVARPSAGVEPPVFSHAIADRDVPLFALLRSTVGLPSDNDSWWPNQPGRRRRRSFTALTSDDRHSPPGTGRHTAQAIDVGLPWGNSFAPPTVSLLERTLAGLRGWTGASADVDQAEDLGHRLSGLAAAGAR